MTIAITGDRPSPLRRAAAAVALVALFAALLYLAVSAIYNWFVLLVNVASLGVAVVAAWHVLSRRGLARIIAVGIAVLALLVFVVVVVASEGLIVLAVGLGLAAVSIGAASYALDPATAGSAIERAPRAHHPVLLMNPKSGGGKAERFRLEDRCRERGIEPIVLQPGDDLRQLAEDAVAGGADPVGAWPARRHYQAHTSRTVADTPQPSETRDR